MSWHDPDRDSESQAESALRDELRGLLGIQARPANYFETEVSPELVSLAEDLRREARRRNHTVRRRSSWMLAAAALPFALALGGVGTWGIAQKHKVDQLAQAVARQRDQIQQLAAAQQPAPAVRPVPVLQAPAPRVQPPLLMGHNTPRLKPRELVIPVQPLEVNPGNNESVKAH